MSKKTLDIKLLGQKIVVKSQAADPDLTEKVVELVNRRIKSVEARLKIQSPQQIAVVALLELAEDYLSARQKTVEFKRKITSKSNRLLGLIEASGPVT